MRSRSRSGNWLRGRHWWRRRSRDVGSTHPNSWRRIGRLGAVALQRDALAGDRNFSADAALRKFVDEPGIIAARTLQPKAGFEVLGIGVNRVGVREHTARCEVRTNLS